MQSLFLLLAMLLMAGSATCQLLYNVQDVVKANRLTSVTIEMMNVKDDIKTTNPQLIGAGFLVYTANKRYTITNEHVARQFDKSKVMLVGQNTEKGKVYEIVELYKSNIEKDVSILVNRERFISKFQNVNFDSLKQKGVGLSLFGSDTTITEGLGVITIGYPLQIGSTIYSNRPVVRTGIVAQSVTNGMFLLDGMSNKGNSGSPVYSAENGSLLGIISSGPPDYINAYDEQGNLIVKLPYNSGLTICITASEILKLIQ